MALLSEARFGVQDPTVQSPDNRLIPRGSTTTAQAIEAFGDIGGQIRQGMLKGELKNEIEESANIISSINAGYPQLQKDIESGRIDDQSEKFYRLSLATEQGKISQQRAQLEAEVLLRSSIAKAPGFADQFRQVARDTLGFDPTGAALNSLFLSGPSGNEPLTQEQKDIEQAQAMVAGGAVTSVAAGVKLINEARVSELRQTTTAAAIRRGELQAGRVAVEGAQRISEAASGVMLQAFQQIRTTGGVQDIESLRGSLLAISQQETMKLEREMAESAEYQYTPEAYNQVRARAEEMTNSFLTLLDNQDTLKILTRDQQMIEAVSAIGLHEIAPHLAILSGLGESAVTSYIELLTLSKGDERVRQELIKRDPRYKWVAGVDVDASGLADAVQALASKSLSARVQTGQIPKDTADTVLRDAATRAGDGRVTPEEFDNIVTEVFRAGRQREALSVLAKNPASHANLSPEARQVAAENINQTTLNQASSIAAGLRNAGFELQFDGRKFNVVDPRGRSLTQLDPLSDMGGRISNLPGMPGRPNYESDRLANKAGVKEAVDLLNGQLVPIMENVQWANEAGFGNMQQWARSVANQTNSSVFAGDSAQGSGLVDEDEFMGFEGFVATSEPDPAGNPTIGFGHKGDISPEDRQAIGIPLDAPIDSVTLTEEQATELLRRDIQKVYPRLQQSIPQWDSMGREARKGFLDMSFHMGVAGVQKFKKTLKALKEGDRDTFIQEFEDSDYYRGWLRDPQGKLILDENGEPKVFRGIQRRAEMNKQRILQGTQSIWQTSGE
jgi:lysozyme